MRWVASFAGTGYLPRAPGTWGSLVALALDLSLRAAKLVAEFALLDEADPAPVFTA